jgi:hypothetical protein
LIPLLEVKVAYVTLCLIDKVKKKGEGITAQKAENAWVSPLGEPGPRTADFFFITNPK